MVMAWHGHGVELGMHIGMAWSCHRHGAGDELGMGMDMA